jgi:hypothetical protein
MPSSYLEIFAGPGPSSNAATSLGSTASGTSPGHTPPPGKCHGVPGGTI